MTGDPASPRFVVASDQALLVRFAEERSDDALASVRALAAALARLPLDGVVHWQPSYAALLVRFDPLRTDADRVAEGMRERLAAAPAGALPAAREVEVPVAYGGAFGPDLSTVAAHCGCTEDEVVAIHSTASYRVDFFGFVAGFAYLSGLPEKLAVPRLAEPRRRVEPGSVAIGGGQTGIYPAPTPGGWRLIGRSPLRPARFESEPWTLYSTGDRVRFVPISESEFARANEWP